MAHPVRHGLRLGLRHLGYIAVAFIFVLPLWWAIVSSLRPNMEVFADIFPFTVNALLPSILASVPPSLKVDLIIDRTTTIKASVHEVEFTLLLTCALVVAVLVFMAHDVDKLSRPRLQSRPP